MSMSVCTIEGRIILNKGSYKKWAKNVNITDNNNDVSALRKAKGIFNLRVTANKSDYRQGQEIISLLSH